MIELSSGREVPNPEAIEDLQICQLDEQEFNEYLTRIKQSVENRERSQSVAGRAIRRLKEIYNLREDLEARERQRLELQSTDSSGLSQPTQVNLPNGRDSTTPTETLSLGASAVHPTSDLVISNPQAELAKENAKMAKMLEALKLETDRLRQERDEARATQQRAQTQHQRQQQPLPEHREQRPRTLAQDHQQADPTGQQNDVWTQVLNGIRNLTERMDDIETRNPEGGRNESGLSINPPQNRSNQPFTRMKVPLAPRFDPKQVNMSAWCSAMLDYKVINDLTDQEFASAFWEALPIVVQAKLQAIHTKKFGSRFNPMTNPANLMSEVESLWQEDLLPLATAKTILEKATQRYNETMFDYITRQLELAEQIMPGADDYDVCRSIVKALIPGPVKSSVISSLAAVRPDRTTLRKWCVGLESDMTDLMQRSGPSRSTSYDSTTTRSSSYRKPTRQPFKRDHAKPGKDSSSPKRDKQEPKTERPRQTSTTKYEKPYKTPTTKKGEPKRIEKTERPKEKEQNDSNDSENDQDVGGKEDTTTSESE